MASAFAFGYMLAVPLLTTLTDRVDARGILLAGSALSALATLAFGALADGLGRQLRFGGSQASALPVPICQASRRAPTACLPATLPAASRFTPPASRLALAFRSWSRN